MDQFFLGYCSHVIGNSRGRERAGGTLCYRAVRGLVGRRKEGGGGLIDKQ